MSPHMSSQYDELWLTSGWDLLASLGHPSTCQWISHLGSVTSRHSSSGCQPNFAAFNRGRHLYSAGQPSRWALAHILVANVSPMKLWTIVLWVFISKCWKCCLLCQLTHEVDQHCIYAGWSDVIVICGYIMISMLWGNTVYCTKLSREVLSRY